jgi:hypothetical protein
MHDNWASLDANTGENHPVARHSQIFRKDISK